MPSDKEEGVRSLSRHPLVVVVVAFALSGVLGTVFSQWLSGREEESARIRTEAEARKTAVQSFSKYVYERRGGLREG
jgi:hypothetical protein